MKIPGAVYSFEIFFNAKRKLSMVPFLVPYNAANQPRCFLASAEFAWLEFLSLSAKDDLIKLFIRFFRPKKTSYTAW
jgi:hypothetical protein